MELKLSRLIPGRSDFPLSVAPVLFALAEPMFEALAKDRVSPERIVVTRSIEVDDVAFARILKHRAIRKQRIVPDRWKF
jgi:hypothetical protein